MPPPHCRAWAASGGPRGASGGPRGAPGGVRGKRRAKKEAPGDPPKSRKAAFWRRLRARHTYLQGFVRVTLPNPGGLRVLPGRPGALPGGPRSASGGPRGAPGGPRGKRRPEKVGPGRGPGGRFDPPGRALKSACARNIHIREGFRGSRKHVSVAVCRVWSKRAEPRSSPGGCF